MDTDPCEDSASFPEKDEGFAEQHSPSEGNDDLTESTQRDSTTDVLPADIPGESPPAPRNSEAEPEDQPEVCLVEEESSSETLIRTPPPLLLEDSPCDSPLEKGEGDDDQAPSDGECDLISEPQISDDRGSLHAYRSSMNSVENLQMKNALLYKNLSEICSTDRFGFSLKDGFRHSLPKASDDMGNLFHF